MIYSARLKQIVRLLLKQPEDQYITVDELSSQLNVSRRTIFRELESADFQLNSYPASIESRKMKGLRLSCEADARNKLENELVNDVPYRNREERLMLLAYELVRNEEVKKLSYYASLFQVSSATISNDLEALKPQLESFNLKLVHPGKNRIELVGSETSRRAMMSDVIYHHLADNSDTPYSSSLLSNGVGFSILSDPDQESIYKLFDQNILRKVLTMMDDHYQEWSLDEYAPNSLGGLIIHLVVAIERIARNETIVKNQEVLDLMKDEPAWFQASQIARGVEEQFGITMDDSETAFIAIHLKGAKKATRDTDPLTDDRVKTTAKVLMDGFDADISLLLSSDPAFLQGLWAHLEPALIRIDHGMPIYNPLLEDLKSEYPELFAKTMRALDHVRDVCHVNFSEAEAGFITMHVGASLEKNREQQAKPIRCSVLCASGIGVSALLAARLQNAFGNILTIHTRSFADLMNHDLKDTELLISTFPVEDPSMEFVEVSPLLTNEDIERVGEAIAQVHNSSRQHPQEENDNFLENLQQIQEASLTGVQLIENCRFVDIPADSDNYQAIHYAAQNAQGNHEQIEKDLLKREELGSVIASDFGFALFHTTTDASTLVQIIALYPDSGSFSQEKYEGVEFILCEIAPNTSGKSARNIISMISSGLIENEGFNRAFKMKNSEKIKEILAQIVRDYLRTLQ